MDSRIPKPASFTRKPLTSSSSSKSTFDFSSFRLNSADDPSTSTATMQDKKPLSELNRDLKGIRRARSPEPQKSTSNPPPKLRRSKSVSDLKSDFRGFKRPLPSKSDIIPLKRLKPLGTSGISKQSGASGISKPSTFNFNKNQSQEKKAAIANMLNSDTVGGIANVVVQKKPTVVAKSRMELNKQPSVNKSIGNSSKTTSSSLASKSRLQTSSVANKSKTQTTATVPAAKAILAKPAPYDFKARFGILKVKHDELKIEFDNLKQTMDEQERIISEFNTKEDEFESKILQLQQESDIKSAEIEKLNENISELQTKCSNLITKNTALADALGQSSTELADAKKKLVKLEAIASDYENIKKENLELGNDLQLAKLNYTQSVDQLYLINAERITLHNMVLDLRGNIRVFARVRPLLPDEHDRATCVWAFPDETSLEISTDTIQGVPQKKIVKNEFSFDQVFDPNSTQDEIFDIVVPLIQSALDGFNVCIFAYGQTGSGKTFTMDGPPDQPGIIPRTVKLLFDTMESSKHVGWSYSVSVSFLEIYNEVIYDLLSNENKNIEIRMADAKSKTEIYLSNITIEEVENASKLYNLMKVARSNRATASTVGNERSSRSHAVTRIELVGVHSSKQERVTGTINLVDLAGSESPKTSTRMDETKNINRSLSELSNVILALVAKNEHVPYRNSKLTHLLMPSLGGNSKTLMFVNVSPLQDNFSESVKSLRFASQVNSCKLAKAKKNKQAPTFGNNSNVLR